MNRRGAAHRLPMVERLPAAMAPARRALGGQGWIEAWPMPGPRVRDWRELAMEHRVWSKVDTGQVRRQMLFVPADAPPELTAGCDTSFACKIGRASCRERV